MAFPVMRHACAAVTPCVALRMLPACAATVHPFFYAPLTSCPLPTHPLARALAGEVYCYADGDKPPVGQGLNTDAEVTLYGVYKVN